MFALRWKKLYIINPRGIKKLAHAGPVFDYARP